MVNSFCWQFKNKIQPPFANAKQNKLIPLHHVKNIQVHLPELIFCIPKFNCLKKNENSLFMTFIKMFAVRHEQKFTSPLPPRSEKIPPPYSLVQKQIPHLTNVSDPLPPVLKGSSLTFIICHLCSLLFLPFSFFFFF